VILTAGQDRILGIPQAASSAGAVMAFVFLNGQD
jgi:hypothetical protein